MVFGYMVVLRLLVLVRAFSRLPDPVSRLYARAATNGFTTVRPTRRSNLNLRRPLFAIASSPSN